MRGHRTFIGLAAAAVLIGACKPAPPADPPRPPPATRVSMATQPTTAPVEASPAAFTINGQSFTFPPAKLVLKTADAGIRVTLFSDDPPEAVRDGYQGNSFYFRFVIDAETLDDLVGQQYVYRTSMAEKDETTSGLFVAGGRQTLRPTDAAVNFDRLDGQVIATIAGDFKLYDEQTAGDTQPIVRVRAMLEPVVIDSTKKPAAAP